MYPEWNPSCYHRNFNIIDFISSFPLRLSDCLKRTSPLRAGPLFPHSPSYNSC